MSVTVITPALPDRTLMLDQCMRSVTAQTLTPAAHLIGLDHHRVGCARTLNRLLAAVDSEWVAILADDDLADPDHLQTLLEHADGQSIVYTYCRVTGRPGWNPNSPFDPERLQRENFIPATALIRTRLARRLNGWRTDAPNGWEDWDFWKRALEAGATFRSVPRITWTYRFHGANDSWRP